MACYRDSFTFFFSINRVAYKLKKFVVAGLFSDISDIAVFMVKWTAS
jgi:hypothetical protein